MKGRVYFLGVGRYVKIGHTLHLSQRFHMLKSGSPFRMTILGSFPAPPAMEKRLHKRFASTRVRREWFKASEDLMDFIADRSVPMKRNRSTSEVLIYVPDGLGRDLKRRLSTSEMSLICQRALERAVSRIEREGKEREEKGRKTA